MLEVLMVLTMLNTAIAVAALTAAVFGVGHKQSVTPVAPQSDEEPTEAKPFKLSDAKMQEGIANLLGYQVGKDRGGDEE